MGVALSPIERAEQELAALQSAATAEPATQQQPSVEPETQQQTPAPQVEQPKDDYYQKWKSLDGMLRKKDEQISQLVAQNSELLDRFSQLAEQQAAQQAQASTSASVDELAAEYGADTIEAIKKVLAMSAEREIAELKAQVANLSGVANSVQHLAEDHGRTKSELFQAELTSKVPEWRTMRGSQEWSRWLDSNTDEITGLSYRDIFDTANSEWNMGPMVALFNRFKAATAAPAPQVDPRAHLVTPGGSGVGAPAASQPKIWRESEVMAAYDAARRGTYPGEQWDAIERDITLANMEGRIVPG